MAETQSLFSTTSLNFTGQVEGVSPRLGELGDSRLRLCRDHLHVNCLSLSCTHFY